MHVMLAKLSTTTKHKNLCTLCIVQVERIIKIYFILPSRHHTQAVGGRVEEGKKNPLY